ncbi:MAG: polyprenol phosphomannose-dependent alpha 1,6 mannosyltransferase MptB [Dermatophilaceae bacterium]
MTALDTRDVAHQTTTSVLRKLQREVQDIRESWGVAATRRGMLATTLILVGSFSPASLPNQNPFRSVPVIGSMQYWPGMALAATLTIVGAFLLLDSWLRLRPSAAHRPTTRGTLWLWVLPLLLAPPLLSFDSYSYAAQGAMVSQGLNPYTDGPGLLDGDYRLQVDPLWQYTPAPYGPLSLQLQHLLVDVSGHNAYLSAVLMRIPATIGVGLIAVYLPRLARKLGYDRETTIWLAVLNPLVVLHLVGGAHNDSLMIGLMVLALWVAAERHLMWAAVAVAAAASVKQPAAAAIIAVAALTVWRTKGEKPTNAEVLRALLPATAVFAVAFAAISLVSGLGFGWVKAMGVPNTVRSMLSPFTMVGTGFEWLLNMMGFYDTAGAAVPFLQRMSQLLGALVIVWLLWRYKASQPVRTLGWVLLVFVISSPVVHPWYLLWGGLIFAMTESAPKARRWVIWVTAAMVIYSTVDAASRNYALSVGATAVAALIWLATGHDRDLNRGRRLVSRARPAPVDQDPDRDSARAA